MLRVTPDGPETALRPGGGGAARRGVRARWMSDLVRSRSAYPILFVGALLESTIFPWPIEFLLAAMMLEDRRHVAPVTAIAIVGSVIGGVVFYFVGAQLFESVGQSLVQGLGMEEVFDAKRQRFQDYSVWIIFIAAQTPVPFQITTMAAGVAGVAFAPFLLAAALARTVRYTMMAVALYFFGPAMRGWWHRVPSAGRWSIRVGVMVIFVVALALPFF
ncbi:MAG: YqaA family protein [Alphaproteobacteria bacterium]